MAFNYKPVLPSSLLSERFIDDMSMNQKINDNMSLKMGTVVEMFDTSSETNQSKLVPEYHVMVVENNNTSIYKNCMSLDTFGSIADYIQFKRRAPKNSKKVKDSGSVKNQEGSIVLLLCLDGKAEQAIIIGSVGHPSKKELLKEDDGHCLKGEFNGLNFNINKDGEMTITFKSATDSEGKPANSAAGGSFLKMEKDGSIELNDAKTEKIRIDKTANTIDILADKDISSTTKANFNVKAEKNIDMQSKLDMIAKAEGNVMVTTMKELTIMAEKAIKVTTKETNIKSETKVAVETNEMMLKGNQMVTIEGGSMVTIKSAIINLGQGGTPALTMNTQFLGTGNLGAPVISQAIGPFSAVVYIAG